MSFGSQLIIKIIHYIGIVGVLICGSFSLFINNKKKKLIFLFLSFLFGGILFFVYYSGILVFIIGIIIVFFYILLYLFVFQSELFENNMQTIVNEKLKHSKKKEIITITLTFLFCSVIGYFIYKYTSGFLNEIAGSETILITTLSDISKQFSIVYGVVIIILAASLFVSFLWFIIIKMEKK